jgi:hypothetical protein
MRRVDATGSAVFPKFKSFRVVLFVFRGRVVALLAHGACQDSYDAILFTFTGHLFLLIAGM